MAIKVGINGFGRIGRLAIRECAERKDIEIVGINNPQSPEYMVYKLRYDTVHGRFDGEMSYDEDSIYINGQKIHAFHESAP